MRVGCLSVAKLLRAGAHWWSVIGRFVARRFSTRLHLARPQVARSLWGRAQNGDASHGPNERPISKDGIISR